MTPPHVPARPRAIRLLAGCFLLVGIAFIQSPGYLIADTKFDLTAGPADFLGRALHLWDPGGAFGQLQNQAYGYLWPMGPFFLLGHAVDLQGWVVQRLWLALVMCVAFLGTARLARALGVRSDVACLVAAFAFATSPRMLSTLGPISIEAWPSAVAPWVLLPLVIGAERGSPRRAALLSAVAVAMVGGVNAVATFAVIPLGAIWLLTRERGARKRSMMLWWPVFTALGTLWWLVPLFVMGSYSPPFLDFIENASVTTFPTTVFDSLRGTSDWVPYVDVTWQGGNELISRNYLALNSGILLMAGLAGLLVRSNPHRRFLFLSLLTGLFLVTMGHEGVVQGWFSGDLRGALDGVLAPVRNVHKFDPVIRLPLVLGLAFVIDASRRVTTREEVRIGNRTVTLPTRVTVVGLVALAVVGAGIPAVAGQLAPTAPVVETPDYWKQAVGWLDAEDREGGGSVALLAPGTGFATYRWGTPRDEPVQYLNASSWAVRNAIPLTPQGNIRMLDAFEARMAQGVGSTGLADFLRRAGVGRVVVRNDLEPGSDVPDPVLVHQALADSPGLSLVASFGPDVGGEPQLETEDGRLVVNGGWQDLRPAIEIYALDDPPAAAVTASELPVVVGAPEDLLDLADAGTLPQGPVQLAADLGSGGEPSGPVILTDGLLDRERFFGRVHDASSSVHLPGDVRRSSNPVSSYYLPGGDRWTTTGRLDGAEAVSASSSLSDANTPGGSRPGFQPFAAVDGDAATEWRSGSQSGAPWWQLDLKQPLSVQEVTVRLADDAGPERTQLRVVTAGGASEPVSIARGAGRTVRLTGGPTPWIRVEAADGEPELALAEVSTPGVTVDRRLVLPVLPDGWRVPGTVVLRSLLDGRTGCAVVEDRTPCRATQAVPAEEPNGFDRVVTLPADATYTASLTVVPRPGPELDAALQADLPINVTGSSEGVPDPRGSALAAIDGDPGTSWTPDTDDGTPTLSLAWLGKRTVSALQLSVIPAAPVRRPTSITVTWPGGERELDLDDDGRVVLDPPIRTDQMRLRLDTAGNDVSITSQGGPEAMPVGISELQVIGVPFEPILLSTTRETGPCGSGPDLQIAGKVVRTALVASRADLYAMKPVTAGVCGGPVQLAQGENVVRTEPTDTVVASRLVLRSTGAIASADDVATAAVTDHGPVHRTLDPRAGAGSFLAVRQNENAGWEARQSGRTLRPVVVDGWQQGWVVDGTDAPVTARFGPDGPYRAGLLAGLVLLVLLFGGLLVPRRRWPGRDLPAVAGRELSEPVVVGLGLLATGLLGGWVGLAVGAVGVVLALVVRRRWRGERLDETAPWAVGGLLLVASFAYFLRPWGDAAGWGGAWSWPHYAVLLALGLSAVLVGAPGSRPLSRRKGRSTSR